MLTNTIRENQGVDIAIRAQLDEFPPARISFPKLWNSVLSSFPHGNSASAECGGL
jgi:hypothetical protein